MPYMMALKQHFYQIESHICLDYLEIVELFVFHHHPALQCYFLIRIQSVDNRIKAWLIESRQ